MYSGLTAKDHISHYHRARAMLLATWVGLSLLNIQILAQTSDDLSKLTWSTDSTGPRRFVSVHGRRAAIFGYGDYGSHAGSSDGGLEVWAYPFQIVSSYGILFRPQGETTGIDGPSILRRVIYSPEAVTRIYAGPDFIVREKLFVPVEEPGAIIRYEVESAQPIDIVVRFMPILDLMWPASVGGQEAVWNADASAYFLFEPLRRFTASIGSPDIVAHDEAPNQTQRLGRDPGLAFTIRAGGAHSSASVIVASGESRSGVDALAKKLLHDAARLEQAAVKHYSDLLSGGLQIETPDADTNRALAWAQIALDQAWVCNPDLGCGQVAGYGPSRKARRPQYDWFFAGDGMVTVPSLLAAGQYDRARQELEFILKYQDQKTGMIWHEMTQSAAWLDWSKYPYMFVHVELTFDFLNTMGDYLAVTGDRVWVRAHWPAIQSAYQYCHSLLDTTDGLPRIPAGKQGAREQDPLSDELALSASWVEAAQAFVKLAVAAGHAEVTQEATAAAQRASLAIRQRYWDERQNFWITGYTRSGTPLIGRDLGPVSILEKPFFSESERNSVMDQLAASDFESDWGTRGQASNTQTYDPDSYASGSVWAVSTSSVASAFWSEHRPATALPIWSALVDRASLDSLGHMHEALAGDFYHEELESVPEQTWSSASFLSAAVYGLLGLQIDGASENLTFAPHLPASWASLNVKNLRVGDSQISFHMSQSEAGIHLHLQNNGTRLHMIFDPEIPLGAQLESATLGNQSIPAMLQEHAQDAHARMEFTLPHGSALLEVRYHGGVSLSLEPSRPLVGDASKGMKITAVKLQRGVYTIDFDYLPPAANRFRLRTNWPIQKAEGATFEAISPMLYELVISPGSGPVSNAYRHGQVKLVFDTSVATMK